MARSIDIAPGGYLMAAVLLMVMPLSWILPVLAAAGFHEFCHWLAVRLCGGRVFGIRVDLGGLVMEVSPQPAGRELICALAGPLGSLLLGVTFSLFPRLAVCGLAQGIFNLMPLFPLDGGRILRSAMGLCFSETTARRISLWVEVVFLAFLCAAGVALRWGILAAALPLCLWFRAKISCKTDDVRIQ